MPLPFLPVKDCSLYTPYIPYPERLDPITFGMTKQELLDFIDRTDAVRVQRPGLEF